MINTFARIRLFNGILHIITILLLPPLIPGIINKVKAIFAGRSGPSVFQLYYDLVKLVRKESVYSYTTTWVFIGGPILLLSTSFLSALIVPLGYVYSPIAFCGDVILFVYLLGLARFATVIAAMDTGSSFEGMGAAREVTFAVLAEPILMLGLCVLIKASRSSSLLEIMFKSNLFMSGATISLVLILIGWFIVFLTENSRIPIDDPKTHLELTMIHEVMILDHSGRSLALIMYASSLKLLILGSLLIHLILPLSNSILLSWIIFYISIVILSIIIGFVESLMARFRMNSIPRFLFMGVLLVVFAFILF